MVKLVRVSEGGLNKTETKKSIQVLGDVYWASKNHRTCRDFTIAHYRISLPCSDEICITLHRIMEMSLFLPPLASLNYNKSPRSPTIFCSDHVYRWGNMVPHPVLIGLRDGSNLCDPQTGSIAPISRTCPWRLAREILLRRRAHIAEYFYYNLRIQTSINPDPLLQSGHDMKMKTQIRNVKI